MSKNNTVDATSVAARGWRRFCGGLTLLGILCAVGQLASCDGGGGGSGLAGASTIRGVVATYDAGTTAWQRAGRPSFPQRLLTRVAALFVSEAMAGVEGVHVAVEGTGLRTSTDVDGSFVISGVPPGPRHVIFQLATASAAYAVEVPPNSVVDLRNVHVRRESVEVEDVDITEEPGEHLQDDERDTTSTSDDSAAHHSGSDGSGSDDGSSGSGSSGSGKD